MRNLSIVRKLIVYFLLLNILTVIIISVYSYFRAKDALVERTFDQLTSLRIEKTYRIESFFEEVIQDIKLISKTNDVRTIISHLNVSDQPDSLLNAKINEEYGKFLKKHLFTGKAYNNLYISDNEGKTVVFRSKDSLNLFFSNDIDESTISHFRKTVLKDSSVVPEEFISELSAGKPAIFAGSPVFNIHHNVIGFVITEINIDAINSIMYENNLHNGLGESGESYLVGKDFLMRSTSRFQNNSVFKTSVKTNGTKQAFKEGTGKNIILDYRGIKVLSSFGKVKIPGLDWVILAEIDESEAMIPIISIRNNIFYISMIILLFLFALVYLIAKTISMPIIRLKDAALKMKSGNYNVTVENYKGNDEITELIKAFNEMSAKIREQTENLKLERSMRLSSVIDGQELERQRLSRELHDGLGQSVLAIKMRLQRTKNASPEKLQEINDEVQRMFTETINEIRNISNNLRPAVLNEFGLTDALTNLCKSLSRTTGIIIDFEHQVFKDIGNDRINTYLYRIAQEALNNIIKHSETKSARIQLKTKDKMIYLNIQDHGKGFQYTENSKLCGNGIVNMKERVQLLNGSIDIQTGLHQGTQIHICIPVNELENGNN
jgi:two-component system NarL family sensor kinase